MKNQEDNYIFIKFKDGDLSLNVRVDYENQTVWLSTKETSLLYGVSIDNISLHVKNILKEGVLDVRTSKESSVVQLEGNHYVKRKIKLYNIDMIVQIGYRIKSKRAMLFKEWCSTLFANYNNNSINENIPIFSDRKYELVEFKDSDFSLNVNVSPDEDTVWLSREQMSILFDRDVKTIGRHINNIFYEGELDNSVVAFFATTATDGKVYNVAYYNLDMIISVGYRVQSKRGIIFRRWANSILKQYLINGYALNSSRVLAYESNILKLETDVVDINNRLKNVEETIYSNNSQIIFEGEIIEPYSFLVKLFFLAKERIIIIDNYADNLVLDMLKNINKPITIYTPKESYINSLKDKIKDNITIINTNVFHDRYIIIDNLVYFLGTSINNIGKKRFTIAVLDDIKVDSLLSNIK